MSDEVLAKLKAVIEADFANEDPHALCGALTVLAVAVAEQIELPKQTMLDLVERRYQIQSGPALPDINPCPDCNQCPDVDRMHDPTRPEGNSQISFVSCELCDHNAEGDTDEQAITNWNTKYP